MKHYPIMEILRDEIKFNIDIIIKFLKTNIYPFFIIIRIKINNKISIELFNHQLILIEVFWIIIWLFDKKAYAHDIRQRWIWDISLKSTVIKIFKYPRIRQTWTPIRKAKLVAKFLGISKKILAIFWIFQV